MSFDLERAPANWHTISGPIETSLTGSLFPGDIRVFNTTSLLPLEYPFNEDYNSGDTIGIGEKGRFIRSFTDMNPT